MASENPIRQVLMSSSKTNATFKAIPLVALILAASGCATSSPVSTANGIPVPQWLNTNGTITALSDEHSRLIDESAIGQVVSLGQTPWGQNTRLKKTDSYFSATGKTCFRTTIETTAEQQAKTLCKYPEGKWGATRAHTKTEHTPLDTAVGGLR